MQYEKIAKSQRNYAIYDSEKINKELAKHRQRTENEIVSKNGIDLAKQQFI